MEYWVTTVPYNPIPVYIHYCQHEEINKNLIALIERLIDRIVTSEKLKTGTETVRPVKENREE
jgi:hypothetical protein